MNRLDDREAMVRKCVEFAAKNQKTLLPVIDQMKAEETAFFFPFINKISNVKEREIKVVLSSSPSHLCGDILGGDYYPLQRYSHKLTQSEAELLHTHFANRYHSSHRRSCRHALSGRSREAESNGGRDWRGSRFATSLLEPRKQVPPTL